MAIAPSLSEELYTKITHFILELIQNADDNTYANGSIPTLEIRLDTDYMDLQSNEVGFSESNIRAICKIGGSTKTDKTQGFIGMSKLYLRVAGLDFPSTGEKGIGTS